MPSLNQVTLIGRLGQDPESDTTNKGGQRCKFSLATDRYNDKDNPDWHRVVVFGSAAEACGRYLHKGALVCVVGRIQYSEHEEKWYTTIIANTVQFLWTDKDRQGKSHTSKAPEKKQKPQTKSAPPDDNDAPF